MLVKSTLATFQLLELPPSITAANEQSNTAYTSGTLAVSPKKASTPWDASAESPSTKAIDITVPSS
jgi:hypothetical protein